MGDKTVLDGGSFLYDVALNFILGTHSRSVALASSQQQNQSSP